jgi:hypothetical protein
LILLAAPVPQVRPASQRRAPGQRRRQHPTSATALLLFWGLLRSLWLLLLLRLPLFGIRLVLHVRGGIHLVVIWPRDFRPLLRVLLDHVRSCVLLRLLLAQLIKLAFRLTASKPALNSLSHALHESRALPATAWIQDVLRITKLGLVGVVLPDLLNALRKAFDARAHVAKEARALFKLGIHMSQ